MSENKSEKIKKPPLFYIFAVMVTIAIVACAVLTVLSFTLKKTSDKGALPSPEEIRNQSGYSGAVECAKKLRGGNKVVTLYFIERTLAGSSIYYMIKYSENGSGQKSAYFNYYGSKPISLTKESYDYSIQNIIANSITSDLYLGKEPSSPKTKIPFTDEALTLIAEDAGVLYYGA